MRIIEYLNRNMNLFRPIHPHHNQKLSLLSAKGLSLKYATGMALDNISFEVKAGQRIAVIGPNGAGKSSLFKIIAGVTKPTSGSIQIYGSEPYGHICIAYLPQRSHVDWHFPASIEEVVMMGRTSKIGFLRKTSDKDREIVRDALDVVGLGSMANRQISQLSGGQQQRVFIARALAQEAELMLMDEPMAGLDANSEEYIFNILDQLRDRKVTVLLSLHDIQVATEKFEKVMLLNHKLLGFGNSKDVFNSKALLDAYGGHLHIFKDKNGEIAISDTCCDGDHDD